MYHKTDDPCWNFTDPREPSVMLSLNRPDNFITERIIGVDIGRSYASLNSNSGLELEGVSTFRFWDKQIPKPLDPHNGKAAR